MSTVRSVSILLARAWMLLAIASIPTQLRADQIEMRNGDRYVGTVVSLNTNSLVLRSEMLGELTLPRASVAQIDLRPAASSNLLTRPLAGSIKSASTPLVARTNAPAEELPAGFKLLAANSALVEKVTGPLLAEAGPEAKAKFNELFGGLMTGKVSVEDIRNEARSAVAQMKALKREVGDDTGMMDGYLSILEKFLGEGPQPSGSITNAGKTSPH